MGIEGTTADEVDPAAVALAGRLLERFLANRRAWDRLYDAIQRLADVDEPPLSDEELEAEIQAARAERRARRASGA